MCGYKYRDILLKELGFQNYKYYLSSELWRNDIRPRVIDEYNEECMICEEKCNDLEIHHLEYSKHNLLGKSLDGMIVLCRKCHKRAEFTRAIGGGKHKRSLREANEYITDIIIEKMTKI
tara:strand:- start:2224 stop:2580 length:357 start_codon:yes stop_codon:yes gene_type:complete